MRESFDLPGDVERSSSELLSTWERSRWGLPWQRAVTLLAGLARVPAPTVARLDVGTRDRALLTLHLRLFGDALDALDRCPRCSQEVEADLSVRVFLDAVTPDEGPDEDTFTVRHGSADYTFRLPTSEDLGAVSGLEEPDARRLLLLRCVPAAPEAVLDDPAFQVAVAEAMDVADPGLDLLVRFTCPDCGESWTAMVDAADFLCQQLDGWAHRVLYDVQLLAGAYGWSERDILDLPQWRRQYYAEALGA